MKIVRVKFMSAAVDLCYQNSITDLPQRLLSLCRKSWFQRHFFSPLSNTWSKLTWDFLYSNMIYYKKKPQGTNNKRHKWSEIPWKKIHVVADNDIEYYTIHCRSLRNNAQPGVCKTFRRRQLSVWMPVPNWTLEILQSWYRKERTKIDDQHVFSS